MGIGLALVLIDVVLAWMAFRSRTNVKRDSALDLEVLRSWYGIQYGRGSHAVSREDVEGVLGRERRARLWHPLIAVAGTLLALTIAVASLAVVLASQLGPLSRESWRFVYVLSATMRTELMLMCALVPITLIEQVLIIRNIAELDIRRLERLLDSLG